MYQWKQVCSLIQKKVFFLYLCICAVCAALYWCKNAATTAYPELNLLYCAAFFGVSG